jgi:hypothetical protein
VDPARGIPLAHERNPAARRDIIASLFAPDAENVNHKTVCRGLEEIVARVKRAHDEWVAEKNHVFELLGNTATHHDLVKFFWRMRPANGTAAVSAGLDIFVLNDAGKIRALYQFIEPEATAVK